MFVEELSLFDLLLSFGYSIAGLGIAFALKKNDENKANSMLMPFVIFKIICAYAFVLIHMYMYRGGDTFLYFAGSKFIANSIINSPVNAISYLFGSVQDFKNVLYGPEFHVIRSFSSENTLFQARLTSLFTLLAFKKYLATTILISLFSAIGIWKLYETLCQLYPSLYKHFAYSVLFFPTLGIWSSGILKDTFTLSMIGFMFYGFYLIMRNKRQLIAWLMIALGVYICLNLKPYILYVFIPAMLIWYHGHLSNKIKNKLIRVISTPILLTIIAVATFFFIQTISSSAGKYSVDKLESLATGFHEWHTYLAETRDQSGYSLGEVEFTIPEVLLKAPESFIVTYFRPWPFEVRNSAMLLESIESSFLLFISLYIIFKVGFFKTLKLSFKNPHLRSFLFFAIAFGIVVGLTSYNFGALSRYKIPCIPFYGASLAIIWHLGRKKEKKSPKPAY